MDIGKLRVQTGATSLRGTLTRLSQKGNIANSAHGRHLHELKRSSYLSQTVANALKKAALTRLFRDSADLAIKCFLFKRRDRPDSYKYFDYFYHSARAHDVPILVAARLLKPLGNPGPNGVKYYATLEIMGLAKDRAWLAKMSNALNQHWQTKNAATKGFTNVNAGITVRDAAAVI